MEMILPKGVGYHIGYAFKRAAIDIVVTLVRRQGHNAVFMIGTEQAYTRADLLKPVTR